MAEYMADYMTHIKSGSVINSMAECIADSATDNISVA